MGATVCSVDKRTIRTTSDKTGDRGAPLALGEFTPNTGAGIWDETNPQNPPAGFNYLGYGILNLGPMPLPGGRIAFSSSRKAFTPPHGGAVTLQLHVMDNDGSNVQPIVPMNIGNALHPTILCDGRIMFSTLETQGLRDFSSIGRMWGLWAIQPDGRAWEPLVHSGRRPMTVSPHSSQAFYCGAAMSLATTLVRNAG